MAAVPMRVEQRKLHSSFQRAVYTPWTEVLFHIANVMAVLTGVMLLTALVVMFL